MKFFVVESDWEELSEEAYSNGRRKSILPFLEGSVAKNISNQYNAKNMY